MFTATKNNFIKVGTPAEYARLTLTEQLKDLGLALCTLICFYLAFPTGQLAFLAWFVMVPIFLAVQGKSPGYAFKLSLITATLGWFCSIWWVIEGISKISNAPANLVLPVVFVFCIVAALPYAVAFWLQAKLKLTSDIRGAVVSALIFTILTNFLPHILPGNLAHALYLQPQMIQLASVGGVALVFFLIHLVNVLIANSIILLRRNFGEALKTLFCAMMLFTANLVFGFVLLATASTDNRSETNNLKVAMIQPNISTDSRSREDWLEQSAHLIPLISHVNQHYDVDLLILPEIPVPVSFRHFKEDESMLKSVLGPTPLLLTSIEPIGDKISEEKGYFNTVELVSSGEVKQSYYKQVLLPFGEYLPFQESLPWLRELFPDMPSYRTQSASPILTLAADGREFAIVPLICYEAVFTQQVRQGVAAGGDILINTSNDAWFSDLAGNRTHLALSLFRSVEYRSPMVRNTNTGISVVIDKYGRIQQDSEITPETIGFSVTEISLDKITSVYQKYGELIPYLMFVTAFVLVRGQLNSRNARGYRK